MRIDVNYPPPLKKRLRLSEQRERTKWPFMLAAYLCPIINLCVGGKAWSVVCLWGLYMAWTLLFSPHMVEYNRISQVTKFILDASVMLVLIEVLLAPGWADTVVPLVFFGGVVLCGVLFFTDLNKQKQNIMPMLWMLLFSVLAVLVSIAFWTGRNSWEFIVLGAAAVALLLACYSVMGRELTRELKKRFHGK